MISYGFCQLSHTLHRYNAYDRNSHTGQGAGAAGAVDAYTQAPPSGYQDAQVGTAATPNAYDQTAEQGPRRMQLWEEELTAQKESVQAGEVGIRKNVVGEVQTLNVPVNREEVYIERKPVAGNVPSDTPVGQDETYRVSVREEQVQVNKQPVVREEINVGKRVVQDNQQVSDTVRREEANIDRSGNANVQGTSADATNTDPRYNQDPVNPNNR
jgi:uncharacterized protein (TIGR02271 family)